MKNRSIALDGPAGAGKSTIAKEIAKLKNLIYIDTGAMYRAVTLKILNAGISLENTDAINDILCDIGIDLDENDIYLDKKCVTNEIRTPEINNTVSQVAKIAQVREKMVQLQRQIADNKDVIMDGRDIGTFVLINANYKFYLTASIKERAHRRFLELSEKGFDMTLDQVEKDIAARDKNDSEREISPLRKAEDAIEIDSTNKPIQEVIKEILSYLK
ncbi:(d)CMP kinase [Lutibacter sp. B2]|nr:(d)CMP kinase [Lutibacter sp. B2]